MNQKQVCLCEVPGALVLLEALLLMRPAVMTIEELF